MREFSEETLDTLRKNYVADPDKYEEYRQSLLSKMKDEDAGMISLFDAFEEEKEGEELEVIEDRIRLYTDDYEDLGYGYDDPLPEDLSFILSRAQKPKEVQEKRVKEKAEVFTSAWTCNLQINLVDDHSVYPSAFNTYREGTEKREWVATESPVKFEGDDWVKYLLRLRQEPTVGEAPYLVSRYDTVSGEEIPLRDEDGNFNRIGMLDRKLRVVWENVEKDEWVNYAKVAYASSFGYEWQGDNLLIARLNLLETFIDYYMDVFGEEPEDEVLLEIAEIVSHNLWQMDGLKMVLPGSCSEECPACEKGVFAGHDGVVSVHRVLSGITDENELIYKNLSSEELLSLKNWPV